MRRVMQLYQGTCANVVTRYGGHIAQTLGDGLLVYFGYPHAHEDDAQRAVHAGLEIAATVSDARGSLRRVWGTCAVRLGISTGIVVVGAFSEWDTRAAMAVVGETPNIASRLQHLAGRNEVLIGPETKRLVEGHFRFESLGPCEIAGLREPLHVWRAHEKRSPPTRFLARQDDQPTKMVGREHELASLLEYWQLACDAHAQAVVITGPAGVGKSRLAHALTIGAAQRSRFVQLRAQCSPYFTNTALYPVAFQLRRAAMIRVTDSQAIKYAKLERSVRRRDATDATTQTELALLARLLQLPVPARAIDPTLGPERLLDDTVEALLARVTNIASKYPVLLLVEDAHWIDPTTLKLVQRLIKKSANQRLMLVVTDRDRPATRNYGAGDAVTYMALEGLSRSACHEIVRGIARDVGVPEPVAEEIVVRSDGLPLYVEELTKAMLDLSQRQSVSRVPSSLTALLTERIDRVGPLKLIAQVGSCIGRSFSRKLLARIVDVDAELLEDGLTQLVKEGILACDSEGGDQQFVFRHALLQGAAYDSMLLGARRRVHAAIASILQRDYREVCEHEPETIARHLAAAHNYEGASQYWLRAAELAQRRSAHVEAIADLNAGLASIRERRVALEAEEFDFQSGLGRSHMVAEGWPGARVGEAYERARVLARGLGDRRKECEASWGLWANRATKGELAAALHIAEESISLAQSHGERGMLLMAQMAALMTHFWLGEFSLAEQHAERIERDYRVNEDRELVQMGNHDPLTIAYTYQSHYLWIQGMPARARRAGAMCIDYARQLGHSFQLCMVLINCSSAQWRSAQSACALNDEGLGLAASQRIPLFRFYGPLHAAHALIRRDPTRKTLLWLHKCLDHVRANAGEHAVNLPLFALNLVRSHEHMQAWQEAEVLLREVFACMQASGERWLEAEAYRIRARLLLGSGSDADEAEHWLQHGLRLAQSTGSSGFELRIACDLADLLVTRSRAREAQELVHQTCERVQLESGDELHERIRRLRDATSVHA
jgi:class 3 adenylate cyclase/tetratricopeptide (TPR) repeat protein